MDQIQTELTRFEATCDQLTASLPACRVKEALRYALLGNGKRLRPLLVFSLLDQVRETDRQIAAALEMVHTYSLIHDDLPAMDDDDLRRGRPTVHKAFDEATAILAGDALLNLAFETIVNSNLTEDKKVLCLQILGNNAGIHGMILGQDQDMFPVENTTASIETMYLNKTGKLLGCALALGCVLSDQKTLYPSFQQIGEELGILFQLQDDLLEIEGDAALIGKSKDSDLKNEKKTYVRLIGIEQAKLEIQHRAAHIDHSIRKNLTSPEDLLMVIDLIKNRSH